MVNLKINNKEISVPKELTILQAAATINIQIPRFCFHEKLAIAGNCRMCLVEILKVNKPVASCALSVSENMQVYTDSLLVRKARESVLELLLANHPLDCPICDQGGECDLQDQALIFGSDRGRFYETKRAVSDKNISPFIKTIMTRCIHCTRCVRFLSEVGGVHHLGMTGRGSSSEIGTYINNSVLSELSGNIIDLCPVGALTSKPYSFAGRSWELNSIETIDLNDALGSNIKIDVRDNTVMRILPKINENLNEEWITDKARFSFDGFNNQRLSTPLYRYKNYYFYVLKKSKKIIKQFINIYLICKWVESFNIIKEVLFLTKLNPINDTYIICGNNINIESLLSVYDFSSKFQFTNILNQYNYISNFRFINNDFSSDYSLNFNLNLLNNIDVCLLVGTNLRLENPLLNSRLRKAFLKNNTNIGLIGPTMESLYNLKKLGNSLKTLISILEGKHLFSVLIKNAVNPLILFGSIFKNNIIFKNLNILKTKFNLNLTVGIISMFISDLIFNTFFSGKKYISISKKYRNFYYLIDADEINIEKLNKEKSFIVYQGSIADRSIYLSDLVLPSFISTEEKSTFFDICGNPQSTNIVNQNFQSMIRNSWKILFAVNCYLQNNNNLNLSLLFKNLYKKLKVFNYNSYKTKAYIKLPIIVLNNFISNFYMTNSVTRVSKVMANASKVRLNIININLLHS